MTTYTAEQQAANRKKWVTALRSGKFQQGHNLLRRDNGRYCCLGVACEVASQEGVTSPWDGESYNGGTALLPSEVLEWLGLFDWYGATSEPVAYSDEKDSAYAETLTELNDSAGWDFHQIADLIERGGLKLGDPA